MPVYVQQQVASVRDSPSEGEEAVLLLGVDGSKKRVRQRVQELDGDVLEELPFDTLRVRVPETAIASLCESVDIESVEYDSKGKVMQGN